MEEYNFLKINKNSKGDELLYDIRNMENGNRVRIKASLDDNEDLIFKSLLKFLQEHRELWSPEDLDFKKSIAKSKIYSEFEIDYNDEKFNELFDFTMKIFYKLIRKPIVDVNDIINKLLPISKDEVIKILLLGQFGVGKSTIIKEMSDIPKDIDFPVVDTSRTTTYETTYVFKDSRKCYNFKFAVLFKEYKEIYNQVQECLDRAINKLINLMLKGEIDCCIQDLTIDSFVSDPDKIFKIEYVLGKYYKLKNPKRQREDRKEQVELWNSIYDSIYKLVEKLFETQYDIKSAIDFDFSSIKSERVESDLFELLKKEKSISELYDNLICFISDKLREKILVLCEDLKQQKLGDIKYVGEEIVAFYNDKYDLDKIAQCVIPFASTESENFTRILTPLVKEMRIEVPYNKSLNQEVKNKTISITDTIGFEHRKQEDTKSLEGSTNLSYNDFDIIIIVDTAKQSMNATTESILDDVYKNAIRSKIVLAYTFYNDFSKKDFEDEYDKEEELFDLQTATLKKIDDKEIIEVFSEELKNRTVFLKDLVKDENNKYEGYDCINKFLGQIVQHYEKLYDFKNVKLIDDTKPILEYNYKKLALVFNYAQEKFLNEEEEIYLRKYPQYKVTEALTRRLKNGETYYSGPGTTLKPVDDFCYIIMEKLDKFIKAPKNINFKEKEEISNHAIKVEDWIKEMISQELKKVAVIKFVSDYKKTWEDAYNDFDSGVDYRRRTKIVKTFHEILPSLDISRNTFADYWIDKIEQIFESVLDRAKKEIYTKEKMI